MKVLACVAAAAAFFFTASAAGADGVKVRITFLDFLYAGTPSGVYGGYQGVGHPDFNSFSCGSVSGLVGPALVNGRPALGPNGAQCITSKQSFGSWFKSTPGVNVPISETMTLPVMNGTDVLYGAQFNPIDGKGFNTDGFQSDLGCSDGKSHNFAFTMQAHWTSAITDDERFILIDEDDDTWLFINGKLVVDMGGVHGQTQSAIFFTPTEMATLGLNYNEPATFDMFHAERHPCESYIDFQTNLSQ